MNELVNNKLHQQKQRKFPSRWKDSHLIEASGEQVEWRHDAAVWSESILLHHLLVVHSVPDVWRTEDRHNWRLQRAGRTKNTPHNLTHFTYLVRLWLHYWCVRVLWFQEIDPSSPMFAGKGTSWTAGSKLMTYGGDLREWRWAVSLWRKQKHWDQNRELLHVKDTCFILKGFCPIGFSEETNYLELND